MGQDDVTVTVYTPEDVPLAIFGTEASSALRHDLDEAGVRVETGVEVVEDPAAPARLVAEPGGRRLDAQTVVALPRAVTRGIGGLEVDHRGFIRTDAFGKVQHSSSVWAAGDAIAFPVKQGGLAAQQADAAAEAIAALAGADITPQPFHPVLRGVLLTGRGRHWIRREVWGSARRARPSGARSGGPRRRSPDATSRPTSPPSTRGRSQTARTARPASSWSSPSTSENRRPEADRKTYGQTLSI